MAVVAGAPVNKLSMYFMLSMLRDDPTVEVPSVKRHHWTYSGAEGPVHWPERYPNCGGRFQSPIDITEDACEYDSRLTNFQLYNFEQLSSKAGVGTNLNFTNNGHSASVRITGDMSVEGGGLRGRYRTAEFHFHWGSTDNSGSEHSLSGIKYPLEMHVVNYATKYETLQEAMDQDDGLAVLGVFFEISRRDNPAFEPLAQALQYIHKSGEFQLLDGVRLRDLLPADTSRFYRYQGSLTTPRCFESVTWTVFAEPQKVSVRQLNRLRNLLHESGHRNADLHGKASNSPGNLVDNWRPAQPLNGRVVRQSFQPFARGPGSNNDDAQNSDLLSSASSSAAQPAATPVLSPEVSTLPLPRAASLHLAATPPPEPVTSTSSGGMTSTLPVTTTTPVASAATSEAASTTHRGNGLESGSGGDPSLSLLTSGNKGSPPVMHSFKSLTEVNDAHDRKTLISGASKMLGGSQGDQDASLQSTADKHQQDVLSHRGNPDPLPPREISQTSTVSPLPQQENRHAFTTDPMLRQEPPKTVTMDILSQRETPQTSTTRTLPERENPQALSHDQNASTVSPEESTTQSDAAIRAGIQSDSFVHTSTPGSIGRASTFEDRSSVQTSTPSFDRSDLRTSTSAGRSNIQARTTVDPSSIQTSTPLNIQKSTPDHRSNLQTSTPVYKDNTSKPALNQDNSHQTALADPTNVQISTPQTDRLDVRTSTSVPDRAAGEESGRARNDRGSTPDAGGGSTRISVPGSRPGLSATDAPLQQPDPRTTGSVNSGTPASADLPDPDLVRQTPASSSFLHSPSPAHSSSSLPSPPSRPASSSVPSSSARPASSSVSSSSASVTSPSSRPALTASSSRPSASIPSSSSVPPSSRPSSSIASSSSVPLSSRPSSSIASSSSVPLSSRPSSSIASSSSVPLSSRPSSSIASSSSVPLSSRPSSSLPSSSSVPLSSRPSSSSYSPPFSRSPSSTFSFSSSSSSIPLSSPYRPSSFPYSSSRQSPSSSSFVHMPPSAPTSSSVPSSSSFVPSPYSDWPPSSSYSSSAFPSPSPSPSFSSSFSSSSSSAPVPSSSSSGQRPGPRPRVVLTPVSAPSVDLQKLAARLRQMLSQKQQQEQQQQHRHREQQQQQLQNQRRVFISGSRPASALHPAFNLSNHVQAWHRRRQMEQQWFLQQQQQQQQQQNGAGHTHTVVATSTQEGMRRQTPNRPTGRPIGGSTPQNSRLTPNRAAPTHSQPLESTGIPPPGHSYSSKRGPLLPPRAVTPESYPSNKRGPAQLQHQQRPAATTGIPVPRFSKPRTASDALSALRASVYGNRGNDGKNRVLSGAAPIRGGGSNSQLVGPTARYRVLSVDGRADSISPFSGAARQMPYVFLHNFNRPVRILRRVYGNTQ